MSTALTLQWITGIMFGLEYSEMDNGVLCIVLDLGILRFCLYRGPQEAFEEE